MYAYKCPYTRAVLISSLTLVLTSLRKWDIFLCFADSAS